MTAEETIRKQVEAFNRHDVKAWGALYSQNAVAEDPFYPEPLKGRVAIEKDISDFFTALPDVRGSITTVLTNGDACAYEGVASGTHTGPMQGPTGLIPATNRPVEFKFGMFSKVDSAGSIVEERRYFDAAGILAQLGLMQ